MGKSIKHLTSGDSVLLEFEREGGVTVIEPHIFQEVRTNPIAPENVTAHFIDPREGFEWSAYRYKGRWAYGTSAQRLSVYSTGTDAADAVLDAQIGREEDAEDNA